MNEFLNYWHFLMAIGQSDSRIEVTEKFDAYLLSILSLSLFIVIFLLASLV